MKDYIERATAIEAFTETEREADCPGVDFTVIKRMLSDIHAADVVPVVRCRECAHYKICDEWENGKRMLCEIHHHSYLDHDGDNHFCSWGQRKIETVLPINCTKDEGLEVDHEVS